MKHKLFVTAIARDPWLLAMAEEYRSARDSDDFVRADHLKDILHEAGFAVETGPYDIEPYERIVKVDLRFYTASECVALRGMEPLGLRLRQHNDEAAQAAWEVRNAARAEEHMKWVAERYART